MLNLRIKPRKRLQRPKASRRIIFNDDALENEVIDNIDLNNNATMATGSSRSTNVDRPRSRMNKAKVVKSKIIDPCFKNVWNKEMKAMDKQKSSVKQSVPCQCNADSNNSDLVILKQGASTSNDSRPRDGIHLSVDIHEEDLDYVDDVPQEDLDEFPEVDGDEGEEDHPALGCAEDLEEEQLLRNPRVKNLFNKLWDEKMKEMNKSGNNKHKAANGKGHLTGNNVVKSPSDTTIYAPALNK